MNKRERRLAREALRHVAERLINGERLYFVTGEQIPGGLCAFTLHWSFSGFSVVCKAIKPHLKYPSQYLCPPGTRYNQRAMFALLLAESLED